VVAALALDDLASIGDIPSGSTRSRCRARPSTRPTTAGRDGRLIPKASGKLRKLGIPTVADRVVQASLKAVLEPIFEAAFVPCSYGFRPNRRAHDAIAEIHHLSSGSNKYHWILEADIRACFDEIDHTALMDRLRVRDGGSTRPRVTLNFCGLSSSTANPARTNPSDPAASAIGTHTRSYQAVSYLPRSARAGSGLPVMATSLPAATTGSTPVSWGRVASADRGRCCGRC
jgi:hypothetical protein